MRAREHDSARAHADLVAELERADRAVRDRRAWEGRRLPEHDVILDRATRADDRAGVNHHVRAEARALADAHVVAEQQAGSALVRLENRRSERRVDVFAVRRHRRITSAMPDARVTPRRSTSRRERWAMRSWSTVGSAVTINVRSASATTRSSGWLSSPSSGSEATCGSW